MFHSLCGDILRNQPRMVGREKSTMHYSQITHPRKYLTLTSAIHVHQVCAKQERYNMQLKKVQVHYYYFKKQNPQLQDSPIEPSH